MSYTLVVYYLKETCGDFGDVGMHRGGDTRGSPISCNEGQGRRVLEKQFSIVMTLSSRLTGG